MSDENEVPSANEDIVMRVIAEAMLGSTPNATVLRVTKQLRIELSALRASWEREKAELVKEYQRLQDKGLEKFSKETPQDMVIVRGPDMAKILAEKQALEAEKKGLEEREHIAGCYEVYGDCTCKDLHERVVEEMKQESLRHLKYLSDANIEITRLKAENEAQTYKGNSIGYIYDKMIAYQTQVFPLSNALKELGFNYPESGKDNMARERALIEWAHNKKESFDTLTCALAEAREHLDTTLIDAEHVIKLLNWDRKWTDVEVIRRLKISREFLTNPTSQRASEEMKGLRKVVEEAKKVTNIASPIYGCDLRGLKDALEAYERGKV